MIGAGTFQKKVTNMLFAEKKIVHITFSYGGGLQTALNEFVSKQHFGSHEILIFSKRDKFLKSEITSNIVVSGYFKCVLKLIAADIVILHSTKSGFLRPFTRMLGKYTVFMPHSLHFSQDHLNSFVKVFSKRLEKILSLFTDMYFLLGWHEVKALKEIGIKNDFYVIGNQLHKSKMKVLDSSNFPKKFIFLCGRIHQQKNPLYLLELLPFIKKYGYEIIWAGDGDEAIRDCLVENGVQVTGWIDSNLIYNYMHKCDFVLHLADMEGLPIVFIEASEFAHSKLICVDQVYSWFIPKKYKFLTPSQFEAILDKIESSDEYFNSLDFLLKKRFNSEKIITKWNNVMKNILVIQNK